MKETLVNPAARSKKFQRSNRSIPFKPIQEWKRMKWKKRESSPLCRTNVNYVLFRWSIAVYDTQVNIQHKQKFNITKNISCVLSSPRSVSLGVPVRQKWMKYMSWGCVWTNVWIQPPYNYVLWGGYEYLITLFLPTQYHVTCDEYYSGKFKNNLSNTARWLEYTYNGFWRHKTS